MSSKESTDGTAKCDRQSPEQQYEKQLELYLDTEAWQYCHLVFGMRWEKRRATVRSWMNAARRCGLDITEIEPIMRWNACIEFLRRGRDTRNKNFSLCFHATKETSLQRITRFGFRFRRDKNHLARVWSNNAESGDSIVATDTIEAALIWARRKLPESDMAIVVSRVRGERTASFRHDKPYPDRNDWNVVHRNDLLPMCTLRLRPLQKPTFSQNWLGRAVEKIKYTAKGQRVRKDEVLRALHPNVHKLQKYRFNAPRVPTAVNSSIDYDNMSNSSG